MEFQGFSKQSLKLMAQIRGNNSKTWFDAHKGEYERYILAPARAFVVEMGEHLQALEPTIQAVPKVNGSLFRIYRDSRFHRVDPIKEHIGFVFWQGRGKRMQSAYFYMHFDADTLLYAAGMRRFKPMMLAAYRAAIKDNARRAALHRILQELVEKGYQLPMPRYKRYPKGFDKTMEHAYLALYDSMFAFTRRAPGPEFFSTDLPVVSYDIFEDLFPLQQWVYAMTLEAEEESTDRR